MTRARDRSDLRLPTASWRAPSPASQSLRVAWRRSSPRPTRSIAECSATGVLDDDDPPPADPAVRWAVQALEDRIAVVYSTCGWWWRTGGEDRDAEVEALVGLADVALLQGKPEAAERAMERALPLVGDGSEHARLRVAVRFNLARALGVRGREPERARGWPRRRWRRPISPRKSSGRR